MTERVLAETLKNIGGEVTVLGGSGNRGDVEVAVLVLVTNSADNLEKITHSLCILVSRSVPLFNNDVLRTN